MADLHIYRCAQQPATGFTDHSFDPPHTHAYAPRRLLWAECCGKRHRAENIVVQCYYDGWRFWCSPGKGCKDPRTIHAAERRRFRNRSRGQKRRWRAE